MNPRSSPPCGPGNLIKSRPLGLQAPLNPARPDLGSFTTEGEGGAPRCKIVVRFARGIVRRREECRPLAPGRPTVHARTPINTDLSRKLCAIVAAEETPANGAANGLMHRLRAILNNPLAISSNTDPSRRVASGGSLTTRIPTSRERFSLCRKRRLRKRHPRDLSAGAAAKEYRPLTQESAVRASKIQTFRTRNADLSRKGCRPFAQGITDCGRKGLPTPRARTAPNTDLSHK